MQRAATLTFMANSALNAIRLANHEARLAAKSDADEIWIDRSDLTCTGGEPEPSRASLETYGEKLK
jgi:hypothetical protein